MKIRQEILKKRYVVLSLMAVMLIAGIVLTTCTLIEGRRAIFREHDQHLMDLASTSDHNMMYALVRCKLELEAAIGRKAFLEAEAFYLETGEKEPLQEVLTESTLLTADYMARILVQKDNEVILSSDTEDRMQYSVRTEDMNVWPRIYRDLTDGHEYLAMKSNVRDSSLTYQVLIDPEILYRRTVVNTVYDKYWIVFYDNVSGLSLFNNGAEPVHLFFTEAEAEERGDGYTLMLQQQELRESDVVSYEYTDSEGNRMSARMAVIPPDVSENGRFIVAVSVFDQQLVKPTEFRMILTIIAAILIASSIAVTLFFILHSGKREKELAMELETLEKKNELTTRLLQRQEELTHHQKLETIGTLTAGIAHEFNNLLSPIMSESLMLLEKMVSDESEGYDNALGIYEASRKAKDLVMKITKLSRKTSNQGTCRISPAELVKNVLSMTAASIPKNITIVTQIRPTACIFGNESDLVNMLLNIVLNAIQAMGPDEGQLTITVEEQDDCVQISVTDTGCGIPEENMDKLFNPFFTTKEAGKGIGLGLAIAQKTAGNYGGTIKAENLPEGGARFTVRFPKQN